MIRHFPKDGVLRTLSLVPDGMGVGLKERDILTPVAAWTNLPNTVLRT